LFWVDCWLRALLNNERTLRPNHRLEGYQSDTHLTLSCDHFVRALFGWEAEWSGFEWTGVGTALGFRVLPVLPRLPTCLCPAIVSLSQKDLQIGAEDLLELWIYSFLFRFDFPSSFYFWFSLLSHWLTSAF
jgi:hypothetical protein